MQKIEVEIQKKIFFWFSLLSMLIWTYCPEASRSGGGYWSGGKLLAECLSLVAETGVYYIVFVTKELS